MITTYYNYNFLIPAFAPEKATKLNVRLPIGGPLGTGGKFAAGLVLGPTLVAKASEYWTLTLGSAPSGTVTVTFTADKVYQCSFAYDATLAAVKAAFETIFGTGNIASVTGTPGTSYVITHGGVNANAFFGGYLAASITSGTASFVRTAGSAGVGQFAPYDNSAPATARSFLIQDFLSDPQGGQVGDAGPTGQPFSPAAYFSGYFDPADLTGLDASAMSDPGFRFVLGSSISDEGALIALGM